MAALLAASLLMLAAPAVVSLGLYGRRELEAEPSTDVPART